HSNRGPSGLWHSVLNADPSRTVDGWYYAKSRSRCSRTMIGSPKVSDVFRKHLTKAHQVFPTATTIRLARSMGDVEICRATLAPGQRGRNHFEQWRVADR